MINQQALALGTKRNTIMELADYGRRRAAIIGKENVFDFSIGNPSVPAPAQVNETILDILQNTDSLEVHSYTSTMGSVPARSAVAADLNARFGCNATAEELLLCCGAAPEVSAVCKALTTEGAEILVFAPYFPEYKPYVEQAGAIFRIVPADIPNFQLNLSALEEMLTPNTSAVIVNNPNNPVGSVYSTETITKLAALLEKKSAEFGHRIYIIADEPYRELAYEGVQVPFIPNIYPHTVVCYSYSKSLSLPGERLGYIYVPTAAQDGRDLYHAILGAARAMGHVCAPSLMQLMLARCAHLQPDLTVYDRNRKTLADALTSYGYEMARPEGAFYIFLKAPGGDDRAFSQKAMAKDLLLMPGSDFGCPGYLRLCYCVSYDTVVRSLPIFRELMEEYRK
jgi:aspartate aminotransferase